MEPPVAPAQDGTDPYAWMRDTSDPAVLAYLAAHADIYRQEFHDNRVTIHCYLPRHLLHHIQGPTVTVQFLGSERA